jgi:hypothetical protein
MIGALDLFPAQQVGVDLLLVACSQALL